MTNLLEFLDLKMVESIILKGVGNYDTDSLGEHYPNLKFLKIQNDGEISIRNLPYLSKLHLKTETSWKSNIFIDPALSIHVLKLDGISIANINLFRTWGSNSYIEYISLTYENYALYNIINSILYNPTFANLKTIRLFLTDWQQHQNFMMEFGYNVSDFGLLAKIPEKKFLIMLAIESANGYQNAENAIKKTLKFIPNLKVTHYHTITTHNYKQKSYFHSINTFFKVWALSCFCILFCASCFCKKIITNTNILEIMEQYKVIFSVGQLTKDLMFSFFLLFYFILLTKKYFDGFVFFFL